MDASKVIQEVIQFPANNKCADWGKDGPEWVSINNGVFICLIWCAKHRSLGNEISKIKSIMHSDWERSELMALQKGGNKSFIEFMEAYSLNSFPIDKKYDSYACYYYRKMLSGYIENAPIYDLPPVKHIGRKIVSESAYRVNSFDNEIQSPVKRGSWSIDLSRSSLSSKENKREQKRNSSIFIKQRTNASWY